MEHISDILTKANAMELLPFVVAAFLAGIGFANFFAKRNLDFKNTLIQSKDNDIRILTQRISEARSLERLQNETREIQLKIDSININHQNNDETTIGNSRKPTKSKKPLENLPTPQQGGYKFVIRPNGTLDIEDRYK